MSDEPFVFMEYSKFVNRLRSEAWHETMYEDSDGRLILVIQPIELFGFINKILKTPAAPGEGAE